MIQDLAFAVAAVDKSLCTTVCKRAKFALNQAGLQVTQGFHAHGLAAVQAVPELLQLYRSPAFMTAIERVLGLGVVPNPNLDEALHIYVMSTKRWLERDRGPDGVTAWIFCSDLEIACEGSFVLYNRADLELARIQPRAGTALVGCLGRAEQEMTAPLGYSHVTVARLNYVDARETALKNVWGAMTPEARKLLVSK